MAWPVCPHCRTTEVPRMETAPNVMPAESQVFRSYLCSCGKIWWTEESIFCADAPTWRLRRKFGHATVHTPVTSDSG